AGRAISRAAWWPMPRWRRPTSTCARPPSTAAPTRCSATSSRRPCSADQEIHMDFDFSDDQVALRDAVQKWVEKGYGFERRRAIVGAGGFDRGAYGELAELGLTGLYIDEAHGGLGMGPVEGMVVMESLGGGIVLEPLAQTLIASGVVGAYGG